MEANTPDTLGGRIARLRKEKGMTQLELADRMGVTDKAVSKWERDVSCPDIASMPRLAEVLGTTVDELMQARRGCPAAETGREAGGQAGGAGPQGRGGGYGHRGGGADHAGRAGQPGRLFDAGAGPCLPGHRPAAGRGVTLPPPAAAQNTPAETAQSPKNHNSKVRPRAPAGWQSAGGLCAVSGRKGAGRFQPPARLSASSHFSKTIQFPSKSTYSLPGSPRR